MAVTAFDVIKEMGRRNMSSLKGFKRDNVRSVQLHKDYGTITMNVDVNTASALMTGDPLQFMLIVADSGDFKKVEQELQQAEQKALE